MSDTKYLCGTERLGASRRTKRREDQVLGNSMGWTRRVVNGSSSEMAIHHRHVPSTNIFQLKYDFEHTTVRSSAWEKLVMDDAVESECLLD